VPDLEVSLLINMNMKAKSFILFVVLAMLSAQFTSGQTTGNATVDQIVTAWSPRNFTTVPVTDDQINLILKCGIKAPSARNLQPWHFTVVRDETMMKQIVSNIIAGNVLIVVSGVESNEGRTPDFDCGLATENMFLGATALGLGARIYGGPAAIANGKREELQIPEGYKVVIILRVGNIDKDVDAVSGASARKTPEELVNYVK
jgi:nitroreductase